MPRKARKRLEARKNRRRHYTAKQQALKEGQTFSNGQANRDLENVICGNVSSKEEADIVSTKEVSASHQSPVGSLSPLIERVRRSIKEGKSIEQKLKYRVQKGKISPAPSNSHVCESAISPLPTPSNSALAEHHDSDSQAHYSEILAST